MDKNKNTTELHKKLYWWGIGLIATGIIGSVGCITDYDTDGAAALVGVAFVVIGIILLRKAKEKRKGAELSKQYLSMIINSNIRQLTVIAATTGKSYETVHKEIEELIKKGYLKGAYVDEKMRAVVLTNDAIAQKGVVTVQPKAITCPCCGAKVTVCGAICECEYCGSPLSGEKS